MVLFRTLENYVYCMPVHCNYKFTPYNKNRISEADSPLLPVSCYLGKFISLAITERESIQSDLIPARGRKKLDREMEPDRKSIIQIFGSVCKCLIQRFEDANLQSSFQYLSNFFLS